MEFERLVPRESAVDACANRLKAAILGGDLAPGERLPAERVMTESFGVNRATLRSALTQLAASRLLSVRQGSGHVVRDYRREGGPDLLPGLLSRVVGPGERSRLVADLLLVRRAIAGAILQRITEQRDDRDLENIAAAVARFGDVVEQSGSPEQVAQADMDVVAALLDATGSEVLQLCINPVVAMLRELPGLRDLIYRNPADNLAGWQALVAWLRERDLGSIGVVLGELERRDAEAVARIAGAKS